MSSSVSLLSRTDILGCFVSSSSSSSSSSLSLNFAALNSEIDGGIDLGWRC